jgi:hypothetical protein
MRQLPSQRGQSRSSVFSRFVQFIKIIQKGYFCLLWQARKKDGESFSDILDRVQKKLRIAFINITWVLCAPMFVSFKYGVKKFDLKPSLNVVVFLFLSGFLLSHLIEYRISPSTQKYSRYFESQSLLKIKEYNRYTTYVEIITYIYFLLLIYLIL